MKAHYLLLLIPLLLSCNSSSKLTVDGLKEPVEILRDEWGVNHIYAQNQHDLFFAQGYAAAKDRLFQFEIWRRQATGTVSEILGEREFDRDRGTRLFKFRGDMTEEMNHYHEDGVEIITAYTNGVNAYIEEALQKPSELPMEFRMLNILPEKWTPEVVISRHQGLLGNITQELNIGRAVAEVGAEKVKEISWFHPKDPDINLDPAINKESLRYSVLHLYNSFRTSVQFQPEDIMPEYQASIDSERLLANAHVQPELDDTYSIGSNNWIVSGSKTVDGNTYMANDPHRTIAVPSLRYMAHLVAPGWDVIGGGEPEIPGISIGHNQYGAWGLTVFRTDGEDLYVYDLNPADLNQYKYKGEWVDMEVINESIKVKDQGERTVDLRYTRHGPVTFIDSANHKGYAVRAAWLEVGGSPYLASLRMDQAKTWEEFREACNYSHIPGENMIWADKEGNIGWQAVGIAPIRRNFSGLVPVPGDGRYEWDGYLPIIQKPNLSNPSAGFFATANQSVTPDDYEHWDAIGFSWSDPYRGDRVNEVLSANDKLTMEDMKALQVDYLSIPARILVPMIDNMQLRPVDVAAAQQLRNWDFRLESSSIAATIYVAWENQLRRNAATNYIPIELRGTINSIQLAKVLDWMQNPEKLYKVSPESERNQFLSIAFNQAMRGLRSRLGEDMNNWQYGQEKYKHTAMTHALGRTSNDVVKEKLNLGPLPRGGNSYTPGSTGSANRQTSGASFRIIVNTGDWDAAVGTNSPGQSGNPESPFYSNLFEPWANDQFFPVYYSKEKIKSVTVNKTILNPGK